MVKQLPREPDKGASDRLYQIFCLEALVVYPYDYFGDLLAESSHGKHNGFFPTPLTIVTFMTEVLMEKPVLKSITQENGVVTETWEGSITEAMIDPCVGTGRMLLTASNYSVNLHGQDIDEVVLKAANINFWLYVPWLIKGINFPVKRQEEEFQPPVEYDESIYLATEDGDGGFDPFEQ